MEIFYKNQNIFRRYIALPQDHGSWVFLLSPLIIGLFAGGSLRPASGYLILAAMAAFLLRQPVAIAVKAYSGRRSRRDLPAARFWISVYGLLGMAAVAGLVLRGFGFVLYLAIPGAPVFAWHLYLVSKRAERKQMGVELVGSGVLALAAPAAYWVGQGQPDPLGWWLFGLVWLQSAASIVYAYLRLEQRTLRIVPDLTARIQMGLRALMYTSFNLITVLGLSIVGILPTLIALPYLLQWAETIRGTLQPAVQEKPKAIGMRQLAVSTLFTLLFILAWQFS